MLAMRVVELQSFQFSDDICVQKYGSSVHSDMINGAASDGRRDAFNR